jgi:predicted MFS family arabinose efflux permease
VVALIAWFALACLEGTFARLIAKLYHYDTGEFGNIFAFESALTVIVQASLLPIWTKKVNDGVLLRVAYFGQAIGLALIPFAGYLGLTPIIWLFVSSTFYGLGVAIASPTVNSICSNLTPPDRQGELFGMIQSTRAIGFIVGPMLGGVLFGVSPALPYVFAGLVCCFAVIMVKAQPKPVESEVSPTP